MKKNILKKYNLINLYKDSFIELTVIIKNIKYSNNINIPEILTDNKNDVDNEKTKIFKREIFILLYALRKIVILIQVDKIQPNKNGVSVVLKKP